MDKDLKKIRAMIASQKPVVIAHSSGRRQKGKVVELLQTGLIVKVTFSDKTKKEEYSKYVNTEDFLDWQRKS